MLRKGKTETIYNSENLYVPDNLSVHACSCRIVLVVPEVLRESF